MITEAMGFQFLAIANIFLGIAILVNAYRIHKVSIRKDKKIKTLQIKVEKLQAKISAIGNDMVETKNDMLDVKNIIKTLWTK